MQLFVQPEGPNFELTIFYCFLLIILGEILHALNALCLMLSNPADAQNVS